MWRKKQRRSAPEPARRESNLDFVFENPLDGLLWQSDTIALLESRNSTDKRYTKHCPTSYCRYDFLYQKRTNFFTTLTKLDLRPACSRSNPCAAFAHAGRHEEECANQRAARQNSVPQKLVEEIVDNWLENSRLKYFLFVDAFAGYGSVTRAVNQHAYAGRIHVVSNDLFRNSIDFDCSMKDCLEVLKTLGFAQMQADTPTLRLEEVAVLFWLSVPCTTYGPQGRGYHRPNGKKISALARNHDTMHLELAKYLYLEL